MRTSASDAEQRTGGTNDMSNAQQDAAWKHEDIAMLAALSGANAMLALVVAAQ